MKVLIINNLHSGLRDGSIFEFIRKLAHDSDEITIRSTDGHTKIESLLSGAESFDCVIASGGDGTIAAVCYALRYSNIPILAFPAGTGNLLTANLDQPEEPYANVDIVKNGFSLFFDMGEIVYSVDEKSGTKGFIVMCGAGYDAKIIQDSERLKDPFGPGAYVIAALRNPTPQLAHFTIYLDDQILEVDGIAVLIMNFSKIFPDISISHGNDARDGKLEIAVLKSNNAIELLPAFFAAFLDRTGKYPHRTDAIEIYKTEQVRIESDPPLYVQYDGEAQGFTTPFEARIIPRSVRLFVTKKEYERLNDSGR